MAHPLVSSGSGMALFSTRNGKYAQRQAASNMSIVIRSDPAEDMNTMTTRLFDEFPEICKALTTFTPQVDDYFDGYDQELHGYEFLRVMLLRIVAINAGRARDTQDYVRRWMATNREAFAMLTAEHTQEHLFSEEDVQEHGKEFLGGAAVQIKRLKEQADHAERYDFMAEEHRRFTQFRDQLPPIANVPVFQNLPASFTSERRHDSVRHGTMAGDLPSQSNRQQGRYSQQNHQPPFRATEYAYTGPSIRPHVYAESTHPAATVHPPLSANFNTTVPSQGFPGPSSSGSLTRAPVSERHQNSNNNRQPKGRRNPVKTSSDDVRRGSFEADARYQTSSRRRFSQPQFVQSPQPIFSPMQQPNNPSNSLFDPYAPTDNSFLGSQQQNRASGSEIPATRNETFLTTESYGQPTPMDTGMGQSAPGTNGPPSNHRDPSGLLQENPERVLYTSESVQLGTEIDVVRDQELQTSSDTQTLESNGVGPQIPKIQTDLLGAQAIPANLAPPSFVQHHGQARSQDTPRRSSNEENRSMEFKSTPGSKIWIGGIPVDSSKAAVKSLLEPYCQGLVDVHDLRYSHSPHLQRRSGFTYVDFESQKDAEKALDRIPQIPIPNLTERRFLLADWPRKREEAPNQYQQKGKTNWMRNTSQLSPMKTRNTKIMNDSIPEESGQARSHSRTKSSNANINEAPVSSEKVSSGLTSAPAPTVRPAEYVDVRSSTENPSWAKIAGSAAKEEIPTQPEIAYGGAESLAGEESPHEARDVVADEKAKSAASASAQNTAKAKINPSTVDGANDGACAASVEPKSEDLKTGRRDDKAASSTQAKKANKKQKSKNNQPKTSNALHRSEGVATFEGNPKSENIKPSSKPLAKPTEEAFLKDAALPEHEDDVVKISEAETKVSSTSASTRSSRAVAEPEIQLSPDPSVVTSHRDKAEELHTTEPSQSPIADPLMVTASPEDQARDIKSTYVADKSIAIPTTVSKTRVEATRSGIDAFAKTLDEGKEHYKQVMTRDSSSSAFDEDSSTPFAPPSTAQTSHLPTERSDSISDGFPPNQADSTEDPGISPIQQTIKPDFDTATLSTFLRSDPAAQSDYGPTEGSDAKTTSTHAEHAGSIASSFDNAALESEDKELNVSQSLDFPTEKTQIEKPMSEVDGSSDAAVGVISANSKTKKPLSPVCPNDEAEQSRPTAVSDPTDKVSTPIQTRQKKKPKEFAVAEEINHSDEKASLPKLGALRDEKGEAPSPDLTQIQAEPLISAETRTSKQKKSAKQKKKRAKKTPISAVEAAIRTPSPERSTLLPKPETPFQTDSEMSTFVSRTSTQPDRYHGNVLDASTGQNVAVHTSADRTENTKLGLTDETCANDFRPGSILTVMPSDSSIVRFSQIESSAYGQEGISSALEEAGYHLNPTPDSSSHFAVKDRTLGHLGAVLQEEEPKQRRDTQYSDNAASSKGVVDRVEEFKKQYEIQKLFEQVAAGRRHQAGLPPHTPTSNPSEKQNPTEERTSIKQLKGDIEKIASSLITGKALRGERDIGNSVEDRKIGEAKKLLDASPRFDSSRSANEWSKKATDYIKENKGLPAVLPPPYTPTRRSRTSDYNRSTPPSDNPFGREEKRFLGSPTVLNRPGSAIETKPGSATAYVPLKRGEDPSKILAEYQANPNAFMGLGRQAQTKPTQSFQTSNHNDSESEVQFTPPTPSPPSPRTVDPRTPSQELGKRISTPPSPISISQQTVDSRPPSHEREEPTPTPPSLRQSRLSAMNLTNVFKSMKDTATSEWLRRGQLESSNLSRGTFNAASSSHTLKDESNVSDRKESTSTLMDLADAALGGPHKENVVDFWDRNSGPRDSETQHEAQPGDNQVTNGSQDRECRGRAKDFQEPTETIRGAHHVDKQGVGKEKDPVSSPDTVLDDESAAHFFNDPVGEDGTKLGELPETQAKGSPEDEVTPHSQPRALSDAGAASDGSAAGHQTTHTSASVADISENSVDLSEKATQKVDSSTPATFIFGSDGSATAKGNDSEAEYPGLPRGHNRSLKGGKSTSPTRGGYAAVLAAKRKEEAKGGKQMAKHTKKISSGDGWVVTGDKAWGSGRSSSTNRKQSHE